ncbi:hypothetical protein DSL64_03540 [Dyadobacter luteus]|uniref:Uncharacterized protein n=1 Tax=Dyadobacter luteus TaxID=2259619 RepID=A0A3D8YGL0_9BACT|nr:hypothetical protein [Dyadobacter luteus]REA63529.1 hypothetical protein DSL64_03540 [Dyadobacter luteus]
MELRITPKFTVTFLALVFMLHEAHEIAHTAVGRLICGCWGERDFNVWGVCEGCPEQNPLAVLATFAGPVFTFSLIWMGTRMLASARSERQRTLGFSLIFANLPFARLLGAGLKGGDEVWGLNTLLNNSSAAWILAFVLIFLILFFPLSTAYKAISNKRKTLWFLLFLIAPILIDVLVVLGVMNTLVENGVLSDYWILGSPRLVTVWTLFVTLVFVLTRANIAELTASSDTPAQ